MDPGREFLIHWNKDHVKGKWMLDRSEWEKNTFFIYIWQVNLDQHSLFRMRKSILKGVSILRRYRLFLNKTRNTYVNSEKIGIDIFIYIIKYWEKE